MQKTKALCFLTAGLAVVTAIGAASPLMAQNAPGAAFQPYVKFELGSATRASDEGYWQPPGAADPDIYFDLSDETDGFFAASYGLDWQNGFRGDLSVIGFAKANVTAPWSRTVPVTAGPHADIQTSVRSTGLMLTGYYSPLEHRGQDVAVQPFLSAGIGIARNTMSDWTRTNAAAGTPVRTFNGDTSTDFAWSLGAGVAFEIARGGDKRPVFVETAYRYFDLGSVSGSAVPLPGGPASQPRTPFRFDARQHVFSVGLRIPM
ncbi:Opacity protein [Jannaschia faecimaris]|uniref:Opacity protein n=1 Tax=Jannaschia faecimaris TaxID=1244108 RepID=A0A1H3TIF9_9RHOB|nr:outer membrane beta-barrel protein [Jannaschia faecimaris]SDZ49435.1 Opacity protein [Jannaschia faecimaris]